MHQSNHSKRESSKFIKVPENPSIEPRPRVKIRKLSFSSGLTNASSELMLKTISSPSRDQTINVKDFVSLDSSKIISQRAGKGTNPGKLQKLAIEELSRLRWREQLQINNSIISDVFMGQTLSTLICNTCKSSTYNFEPFYILELSIPEDQDDLSIAEMLEHFSKQEALESFKLDCKTCKVQREANRSMNIYKLPPIFGVCFKRFEVKNKTLVKNNALIRINLSGEDFSGIELGQLSAPKKSYTPFCIVVSIVLNQHHFGDLDQGHYTCSYFDNHEWTVIDDASVRVLKDRDAVLM